MFRLTVITALIISGLSSVTTAQTVYENYTFITLAGPPEGGAGWYDGVSTNARFNYPDAVAVDANGNLYTADQYSHTIRKITPAGVVTTLAGLAGNSGSGDGLGAFARFNTPTGVAVDTSGNVFVADAYNHTIRKITPGGIVTTFAGAAGVVGTNNGNASNARFYFPTSVAVDASNNVFVADAYNHVIRKITSAGTVTTVAGLAGSPGTANGTGSNARFNTPIGVAVNKSGTVFVADTYNHTIRQISPLGAVTTLAGGAGVSGTNNGTGTAARFNQPYGVAVDGSTNVYVADVQNHTIRKITPAGVVTTLAGAPGLPGITNGPGPTARFNYPIAVAVDAATNVFVADNLNQLIRKISSAAAVTTVAGTGGGSGTNDGLIDTARFKFPSGVAMDRSNNLYVADTQNHTLRKITPAGNVTTFAGSAGSSGSANNTGSAARFNNPLGVATDAGGNLYVADKLNHLIRKISPAGVVTTLAGTATVSGTNNGTGIAARFNQPFGVAVDANTNVYVGDTWNHTIRKITPAGVVTTLAGGPVLAGTNNGTGGAARFNYPEGVVVDGNGNIYVADSGNHTIRKVTSAGVVTTFAGSPGVSGDADGPAGEARFNSPFGLAMDGATNLFVSDAGNSTIRKITPGGTVTTLGGVPSLTASIDGTGSDARFDYPAGLALDGTGNLYVANASGQTIVRGYAAPPDRPVIDRAVALTGVLRNLDVTNLTTTSWSWQVVRQPSAVASQLSAANVRNPTFQPGGAELQVLRFVGTDSAGRQTIGFLQVLSADQPHIEQIQTVGNQRVLTGTGGTPGMFFSVLSSANPGSMPAGWTHLSGGTFDINGRFAVTNDATTGVTSQNYLIGVQ